jgi:hypothetical protein
VFNISEASEIAWDTLPNILSELSTQVPSGKFRNRFASTPLDIEVKWVTINPPDRLLSRSVHFALPKTDRGNLIRGPTRRVGRPNWRKQRCVTLRIGSSRSTVRQNDPASHQLPPTGPRPRPLTEAAALQCRGCQGRRHDPWRPLRPHHGGKAAEVIGN